MLFFYTAGMYCFYHLRQASIQKAHIAEKLAEKEEEELTELRMLMTEISWVDEHEFYFDGKLYDIVSAEQTGDSLFCVAYHDAEEQMLKEKYTGWMGDDEDKREQEHHSFKFFPKFFASDTFVFHQTSEKKYPLLYQSKYRTLVYSLVTSPPPEV